MSKTREKGNLPRKIVSVLIAFLLWSYVGSIENPTITRVIQVPVSIENLHTSYGAKLKEGQVSLTVIGRNRQLQDLTSADFSAVVDMKTAHIGENYIEATVKSPVGVKVQRMFPEKISVSVRPLESKAIPLTLITKGNLQEGLRFEERPSLPIDEITVYASSDVLDIVNQGVVELDLTKYTNRTVVELPIAFLDRYGNIVSSQDIKVKENTLKVDLSIIQESSKEIPIDVTFSGELPKGYELGDITLNKSSIMVYGEEEVLSKLQKISTKEIELSKLKGTTIAEVDLDLPPELAIKDVKPIKVTIKVKKVKI